MYALCVGAHNRCWLTVYLDVENFYRQYSQHTYLWRSYLWRSWAGQRITRCWWIHGATGSFICSWIQGLVNWRIIFTRVRHRFKIFPSAYIKHGRLVAWVKIHSLVKSRRHLERHRRLVGFLTRSITWARVIWISYCSPDCATRIALFVFRGATRISLWYSNWSACEEWSVLIMFGAGAMVATPHPCHCLSIFRGRARPMWISGTAISRLTDTDDLWLRSVCFGSGAQEKSTHGIVFFCEAFQLARTSRRHMPPARIYDTLCDTPFYMVSSDVQVVCTGSLSGFRYAVNFVDGYPTSATTSCGQSLKLRRNWRRLYRIYSRLGRRIGRIISDLKSPWKAHWPYSYGFG